ncbi:eukaryotic aspartyl protease family protein [Striga asiatica]|uniref:Eukaryotic aspartyl protease family protein n=1 Tax=Striga asiatica TaxID=4170 RepID=A0A5A7RLR1_STRAF|nr:eukaryotic aspartyl protease family protein [Striga asiatica]
MNTTNLIIVSLMFSLLFMSVSMSTLGQNSNNSNITVTLIHRDSVLSPLYDPSLSPTQRLANAVQRSLDRAAQAQAQAQLAPIENSNGDYLFQFAIDSFSTTGYVDTGSDLIWTPCGSRAHPSSTPIQCRTKPCTILPATNCSRTKPVNSSHFKMKYASRTSAEGNLFEGTFTLGGIRQNNIVFGCDYTGTNKIGIVGVGGGQASLVQQLGQGKFSYCLSSVWDNNYKREMTFGGSVMGRDTVTVPLQSTPRTSTFYIVELQGFSFGRATFHVARPVDMIVDSGTTVTNLPENLYNKLRQAVVNWAQTTARLMPIPAAANPPLDLCFTTPWT